jgi:hypothetical protein
MHLLLPIIGMALVWAWWSGRLKRVTLDDAISIAVFLLGLRLLTSGKVATGAVLMAGALLYAGYRRGRFTKPRPCRWKMRAGCSGVSSDADLAEIRAAHRRLIARVHPDAGGSEELASGSTRRATP